MVNILQFELPPVRVDNSVWTWLAREKLENLRLSTSSISGKCHVMVEPFAGRTRLVVSHGETAGSFDCETVLFNTNTAKDFREFDRKAMFDQLLARRGPELERQSVFVVSFADLKSYTFTFNVALPSVTPVGQDFEYLESVLEDTCTNTDDADGVYISKKDGSTIPFSACKVEEADCVVFRDSKLVCSPGCLPMYVRNYLTSIASTIKSEIRISIKLTKKEGNVIIFKSVRIVPTSQVRVVSSWVKWPVETGGFTTVQCVDLKRFLDPVYIASESVQLNVKLIKWRLIPQLEPEKMSSLRFLLIGAGTLGCSVARCLISWGVSKITFVDSGKVSFSNPSRQWLFRLEDAISGAGKAETAAERLREILPSVDVQGINLSIPLPGHPGDLEMIESTFSTLNGLVASHDVVFMLTDSRESRWLPTLMVAAAEHAPLGVSVALGFDSYLVKVQSQGDKHKSSCYFCNDVNSPSDQTMYRTLDQMCTVTRPGLAAIASGVAVELVASLTQMSNGAKRCVEDTSLLGGTPDQVRGFLSTFQSFPAVTEPFSNCICCSERIVAEFKKSGIEMVKKSIQDSSYLMRVSGLDDFTKRSENNYSDVINFTDDEEGELGL